MRNKFSKISSIIQDAKKGKMFILVDDKDRENEGDLVIPGSKCNSKIVNFMAKHGTRHRSFGHGAVHGVMAGVFMATPIIGIISLFERRTWKYVLVNAGYWILTLGLMGGVICQFL